MQFLQKIRLICCTQEKNKNTYQVQTVIDQNHRTLYVNQVQCIQDWKNTGSVLKVSLSPYHQILRYLGSNEKWTDTSFPPVSKSLGSIPGVSKNCHWKRISQIFPNSHFFKEYLSPSQIVKGSLKNCYFLSTLAVLCEPQNNQILLNLVQSENCISAGIFKITLRINGVIEEILVDDHIPVNKNNQPIFCVPYKNEIWVMILEKAWAKSKGSYAAINIGTPCDAFKAITYAPAEIKIIKNESDFRQKLWVDMLTSTQKNHVMCCCTVNQFEEKNQLIGLTPDHIYTVISVQLLKRIDDLTKCERIIMLRDPWEKQKWRGQGCSTDNIFWNKIQDKDKQNFFQKNKGEKNGIFFLLFTDFCKYFMEVHFCYVVERPVYDTQFIHCDKKHGTLFIVQIQTQADYIFQLHQNKFQLDKFGINRSTLMISNFFSYQFIDGSLKQNEEDNKLKTHLKPGKYFLYAKIDPQLQTLHMPDSVFISSYSNFYAKIREQSKQNHSGFWKKTFLPQARKNKRKEFQNGTLWISWKLLFQKGGFAYLAFGVLQNSSKKFVITIDQNDFIDMGYILKKPHKGKGKQVFEIKPGQQQIIVARVKNSMKQSMKFPPQMSIQMIDLQNMK